MEIRIDSYAPLVSVVIPAFNAAPYLQIAIDSVLAQSYPNLELIVLDDGSTDDTRKILQNYPEKSFYRESHANIGQSATLNKGWERAGGEVFSYLSADDVLLPHAVATAVQRLNAQPKVVMVYGDYDLIDEDGIAFRRVNAPEFNYQKLLGEVEVQPGPGVFFRRSAFEQIGGWNPRYRQIPDFEYWIRLGLIGHFERIPEALAQFRVHADSQTYAPGSIEKSEEILSAIGEFFADTSLPDSVKKLRRRSQAFAYVIAARLHLRAGRYARGIRRLLRAWSKDPSTLYSHRHWQLVGNALRDRWRFLRARNK